MSGLKYGKTHFAEGRFIAANLSQLPFGTVSLISFIV